MTSDRWWSPHPTTPTFEYDVVGPVCETGDTFARARALPQLKAGDLVAFMTAGAYGAAMASEYNSRLLVPEALGERWPLRDRAVSSDLRRDVGTGTDARLACSPHGL